MTAVAAIIVLLIVTAAIGYALLEKRPGYGAYYGLAKLTGSRLDIGPVDWATLTRHATPNDARVCPPARCPNAKPDWEPKTYAMVPGELLARLQQVALAEPNVTKLPPAPNRDLVARFVQRTRLMRYPDTIDIEVFPAGAGSTLAIYSRSLIGSQDFGVNRARVARWLAALDAGYETTEPSTNPAASR
jgi:uncharacterized protein (DUF1499 family)